MAEAVASRVFVPVEPGPAEPAVPAPGWPLHRLRGSSMGTDWSVQAYAPPGVAAAQLQAAIVRELDHAIALFSSWHGHSEVARFNAAPAGAWRFSPPCWALLADSLAWAQASGGAVDPTLGALVDLWGFGPAGPRPAHAPVPEQGEIARALQCSGWQRVQADPVQRTLRKPAGLRLDLSGIAKGWAVDQVSARLEREGARAHLVEIGGELKARGLKHDLQPWWVALEDGAAGPPQRSLLALVDMAVATSGDYRRYIEHGGRRYAHTIDGRTGWPVAHGTAAVTVLHAQAAQADALATALTAMAPPQALDWADRQGLAVRLTLRSGDASQEHLSRAMAAMLEPAA
ncbi:FAD:protein FMN transferase [Pseudorhodoferax sp.]|uniref:FAD:protein FMN transferase n=1 Tax=Pseudorhodoferax sp. TaxID=1993553 RepID=UPI002DD6B83C|nr:FAD:protein FMN transferase [Pseudorhodoferax sp.]